MNRNNEPFELQAYVTNLGRYNDGELIGMWVTFPVDNQELQKIFDEIELNDEYEEYFITDYDGYLPKGMHEALGEYISISTLNKYGLMLEKINELGPKAREQFEALCGETNDLFCAAENVLNGGLSYMSGIEDMSDYARYLVSEFGYDSVPNKHLYIDYEELGLLITTEYPAEPGTPETAGEYWCGDENATNQEIGEAVVDAIGFENLSNPEYFFDFKMYGETIDSLGNYVFTENGCLDMSSYDDTLGENLKEELQEELDEMNYENEHPRYDEER